jgi:hypothetical protein
LFPGPKVPSFRILYLSNPINFKFFNEIKVSHIEN